MLSYAKGQVILQPGEEFHQFSIIASGSVSVSYDGSKSFLLKKGDIVGICDFGFPEYAFQYTALEDTRVIPYQFSSMQDLPGILEVNKDVCHLLNISMAQMMLQLLSHYKRLYGQCENLFQYLNTSINNYLKLCSTTGLPAKTLPRKELLQPLSLDDRAPDIWLENYYAALKPVLAAKTESLSSPSFVIGFLVKAARDILEIINCCQYMQEYLGEISQLLLNETYLDLFDLYTDLVLRAKHQGMDYESLNARVDKFILLMEKQPYFPEQLVRIRVDDYHRRLSQDPAAEEASTESAEQIAAKLDRSLDLILEYSDTMDVTANEFRKYMRLYKELPDKSSLDKNVDTIRKQLAKLFNIVYTEVFQVCIKDPNPPIVIKMFLNFGFMDVELAGLENTAYLYNLTKNFHGNPELGVYTFYEWIMAIYHGKKQPSRNEFDQDYTAYIHSLKMQGKIDAPTERRMREDTIGKVMYELENLFPILNKITFGRVTNFCPVFSEANAVKDLESSLVTPKVLMDALEKIQAIDFSVFYRSTLMSDPKSGLRENVILDIRPDFILMPNMGTRGVLWQEIEGMHRSTPGRMSISAFHVEDIEKTLIQMLGAFRWEMCKRVQGARWNDITEHSLTSDYCDYAQFYAKNRELSPDAKEKLKTALLRAKNSFKNLFISDYTTWILSESTGSPKLNKVARQILAAYCPFPAEIRSQLKDNGLFTAAITSYEVKKNQQLHRLQNIVQKFQAQGTAVPEFIETQIRLLNK
ncbi:MAG: cyclic nucleotide-binding domain-containing protein [Lachnospiraceae bacterium]|nr:cyclic nucleotide-binding domain-containing protein [Lachnospiraceae bacterium]